MLKVSGNGGTGAKMFNVAENGSGFQLYSSNHNNYLLGSTNFNASVVSLDYIDGVSFISLSDGRWIKVDSYGGTGYNMFGLANNGGYFQSICGYNYLIGNQNFSNNLFSRTINPEEETIAEEELSPTSNLISIYPNPVSNIATVSFENYQQNNKIVIMDVKGALIDLIYAKEQNTIIDMSSYPKGLYLVRVDNGNKSITKKVIKN